MGLYRSKVVEVEANQFTHPATGPIGVRTREDGSAYVVTLHGDEINVVPGDWIILEEPRTDSTWRKGERAYPCKPDVFERKYEWGGCEL